MPEENIDKGNDNPVDLSGLSDIQFKTAWTPSFSPSEKKFGSDRNDRFRREGDDRKRRKFGGKKDGSFREKTFPDGDNRDSRKRRDGKKKFGGRKFEKPQPFVPTMEVLFYPDDAPFAKMAEEMKRLKRTYQLFEIAHLILEKNERFILLAKNLPDSDGNCAPLYCAQPLNVPFDDEHSAREASLGYYVEDMFERVEMECEAPKGNFQVVNKCVLTGDLLGAPNWHKYGEYVREYHKRKFPKMSFEEFSSKIEGVRDEASIASWIEGMKKREVYKLKAPEENEKDLVFDTWESASAFVAKKKGDSLVKKYEQVRMRGANLAGMPNGRIKRNIEEALKSQKRFPIVTANNLRGRLRRTGFTIYKRGSKSFAFVSSVKRKFLIEGESLSELPQKIFDFVTDNPEIKASEVPFKLLGIEIPKNNSSVEQAPENSEKSSPQEISSEEKAKITDAARELSWLVSEGYIVEYSDGTLQANPRMPKPKSEKTAVSDEPILKLKEEVPSESDASGEAQADETPEISSLKMEEPLPEEPDGQAKIKPSAESAEVSENSPEEISSN